MQKYVRSVLNLPPIRKTLARCDGTKAGRNALNAVSGAGTVYATMEEAWAAARRIRVKHAGHDHPESVDIHMRFAEKARPSDYAALFRLATLGQERLRLFDFGGNVGNVYYCYKQYLPPSLRMEWTVYDIPAILQQGREIALDRGETGLCFTDFLADAAGCDVFLASGSLHYWEQSISDLLRQLECRPRHLIVNRSPFRESGPSFATVQVTHQYCVPCLVRSIADVEAEFADNGYDLIDRWTAAELFLSLPLHPGYSVAAYSGLYFRRRSRSV